MFLLKVPHYIEATLSSQLHFFLVSALLRDYSLCWDSWKPYMTPTLDAALLISSRAGADLGRTSDIAIQIQIGKIISLTGI